MAISPLFSLQIGHRFWPKSGHWACFKPLVLSAAEQLWVSDITYICTLEGFGYLSLITDAYSERL